MKSTRIKRLKTLQHLARKNKGSLEFHFWENAAGEYKWHGRFAPEVSDSIDIVRETFNEMLQALHTKVKTEL